MAGSTNRLLTMTSPLGSDAFLPVRLHATETISEPFLFVLDMVSTKQSVDPNAMLFQPVCVTVTFEQPSDLPARNFHGIVRSFAATGGAGQDRWGYTAELVPTLWFLRQTQDCRIWQNMSAIDVIKSVFSDQGVTAVEWSVTGTPPVRETITQFNETDYDFVLRLLEEEGCFYFFKHAAGSHTLVISNDNSSFKDLPNSQSMSGTPGSGYRFIQSWRRVDRTALGKVQLLDYNSETPATLVQANANTVLKASGAASRQSFTWPALTLKVDVAKTRATNRIEAAEAFATLLGGIGASPMFCPGGKFTLSGDTIGTYVVRRVVHEATDETQWRSGGASVSYGNEFEAFPAATKWRQPLSIPRPRMVGIHTALVIGPSGQELFTDKYSRVQVQFYWDYRKSVTPQQNICWVRVIQPWSGTETGSNWGWHHLPRVGTEVAVSFMDGDPDRPVVVGCFYNGVAMPTFDLSSRDNWTKSGFRSRSSTTAAKGGGSNYSEFSFDDKTGSELVFLHAEKDLTTEVENNQTLKVDNCRMVTVTKDETVDIGKAQTITVGAGRAVTIKDKDDSLTISTGNLTVTTSQGKMGITSNADHALVSNTGNISTKASQGNITTEASMGNISTKADMGNIATEASLGNISVKADAGAVTIEAMQSITLKCGPSTLTIDPTGITLKGMMMTIKADMTADFEGGLTTTVKGGVMLTLKGAIMMLN